MTPHLAQLAAEAGSVDELIALFDDFKLEQSDHMFTYLYGEIGKRMMALPARGKTREEVKKYFKLSGLLRFDHDTGKLVKLLKKQIAKATDAKDLASLISEIRNADRFWNSPWVLQVHDAICARFPDFVAAITTTQQAKEFIQASHTYRAYISAQYAVTPKLLELAGELPTFDAIVKFAGDWLPRHDRVYFSELRAAVLKSSRRSPPSLRQRPSSAITSRSRVRLPQRKLGM